MKRFVMILAVIAVISLGAEAIGAEKAGKSFGPRIGYSSEPDQFVIGGQAVFGHFLKVTRFVPSFDFGTGDNLSTYTFNADVRFLFTLPRSATALYAEVGPTITYWDADKGGSDTEVGATITGGVRFPMGKTGFYNLEGRFGIGDVPEFKIMLGVMFGRN